ncbi:MAG: hypothetical protein ACREJB_19000, partial [Planctomycetaceae bacterium]
DTFDRGVQFLRGAFTAAPPSDREAQAIILHGLAEAGAADFALANRLYRERNALSAAGLLHVALVLIELDRKEMARDLLGLVNIPTNVETAGAQHTDPAVRGVSPWMQNGVELRALFLRTLEETPPVTETSGKLADWLLAARRGNRWTPEKANGPAIVALAKWFGRTKQADEKYTLDVYVNGKRVEQFEVDPSRDATRRIAVPQRFLEAGKPQKINFDMQGRGTFSYSVVLGGFVPADKLQSTANTWRVQRTYEPAQRMLDGETVPRGFGILAGGYTTFKNPLTQLPMGERSEVTLNVYRSDAGNRADAPRDYLVVTEPVPAGTMVLAESIQGGFERYEIGPGTITFYVGDQPRPGTIQYALIGYLPGDYRAIPTVVRSFYQPSQIVVAETKSLSVLPRGEQSQDEYKLTPVELYEFGKRLAAKGRFAEAAEHLTPLFQDYRLQENVYQEVVQLLFRAALETGRNDATVRYFEIIKEKYPEVEIDFESILKVAAAYRELGEYERSYLVFRATVEARFQRESQIAGFLDGQSEFLRSVQVMERLLRDYPAEAYVATASYALAQEVYGT